MEKSVKVRTLCDYDSLKKYGGTGKHIEGGKKLWVTPPRAKHLAQLNFINVIMIRRQKNDG